MSVTANEQMFKTTNSKMLVGNIASPKATRTTTKPAKRTVVAETTTTVGTLPTATTKLSNQDDKHLWHAMLGNFNQQNEQQQDKLACNNNNNNNDDTNLNISSGERVKLSKQELNALRLNKDMNHVNSMQQALLGKKPTRAIIESPATKGVARKMSDTENMHAFSENNSSHSGRVANCYIKQNYERSRKDNRKFPATHLRVPTPNTIQATSDASTTSTAALSTPLTTLSAREASFSQVVREPATIRPSTIHHELMSKQPEKLKAQSEATQDFEGVSGVIKPNRTSGSLAERVEAGDTVAQSTHKKSPSARKRRAKNDPQYCCDSKSSSIPSTEMKTSKMCRKPENSTARTIKPALSPLNFGALNSITLNSTLLALCNATTVTAVAATLSESISSVGESFNTRPTLSSSVAPLNNDFWDGTTHNMSANIGNSSYDATITSIPVDNGHNAFNGVHVAANAGASDIFSNDSDILLEDRNGEYVFDRTDVRIIFVTLYTLVFCCCVFGNLLVILVVTMSRRLRSITNFFLANLALADFCVGIFCVLQNLTIYLIDSWVFGEFLCRMYQFVHSLSYTASIFILVVICMERYFAIVHPITCKQILTAARLKIVIFTVWIASAIYSTPKFIFSKTIKNMHENGHVEEICVLDRKMFDSRLLDMISFGLLYVVPLLVMLVLYTKIAIALWRSSHGLSHHLVTQHNQQQQHQQHTQHAPLQHQQQEQQQDECLSLHNSMYHHHQHAHSHAHNHCTHNHLPPTQMTQLTTTAIATHNINHLHQQHNHLQQTQTLQQQQQQHQQLPNATLTTNSTVIGVVGLHAMGGIGNSSSGAAAIGVCGGGGSVTSGSGLLSHKQSIKYDKRAANITESQVSLDSERPIVSACRNGSSSSNNNNNGTNNVISGGSINSSHKNSFMQHHHHSSTHSHPHPHQRARINHMSHSSNNVLRARRGVVRMLIIFVLTFALCNLPYHARKMWQYWSRSYRGDSNFNALLTPLTFLVTYFNSAINPLLYAFLSRNFRKGMKELLMCSWRKSKGKSSSNSSMHHKRVALQVTHSLPTDTTHIGNEQL